VLRYTVLNPYWNVPYDLAQNSVAPKYLAQGPAYLRRTGFQVLGKDDTVLDPSQVDWRGAADGSTQITVRQLPGPGNGMGAAKFMFPNALGIYLHDTPSRGLFDADERLFSAGCIRVEDYRRLGRWIHGEMPEARGDAPEQRVDVADPVPVYVAYFTAFPTADGFDFRDDIYGRDAPRLAAMERQATP
jgi:murein L,D-transpeptidase YcbB/YkuD